MFCKRVLINTVRTLVVHPPTRHLRLSPSISNNSNKNIITSAPADPVDSFAPEYVLAALPEVETKSLFTCGLSGRSYTGKQIHEMSKGFAAALIHSGVKPKDVVGVLLPNSPEYIAIVLGIWLAGGIVSPISSLSTPEEVLRQCSISQCKVLVTMAFFLGAVKGKIPTVKTFIDVNPFGPPTAGCASFFDMVKQSTVGVDFCTGSKINPKIDIAVLPFSSGTTGPPKAVMITHSNICSNSSQYLQTEKALASVPQRFIGLLPFYHCFGFCALVLLPFKMGCHVATLPKFEPLSYVSALRAHQPTVLHAVPPLVQFMVKYPDFGKEDLKSVHTIICGAAAAGKNLVKALINKAQNELFFQEGYGLTEVTCTSHLTPKTVKNSKTGSIGRVICGTQCKVVSTETGEALPAGKPGELWLKGPQVFKGYYENEQATKDALEGEWFKTGDIAQYDSDNCFYIVDRIKELIKVKGLQVSPSELEDIIRDHHDVADVAVIGIPDKKLGEAPRAFVVRKSTKLTESKIHDFLERKIAAHKKLAGGVEFIEEIPKAASGKILRRHLLEMYLKGKQ